jgi:hypothetical protein
LLVGNSSPVAHVMPMEISVREVSVSFDGPNSVTRPLISMS